MLPSLRRSYFCGLNTLLFIPLIVAGGRLAVRVVLNLWNMLES